MNSIALLTEYVEKNVLALLGSVEIAGSDFAEEAVHDMRVSLKRLRLAFKYADFLFPALEFNRTFLQAFRNIYMSAGNIRELQINSQLIKHICRSEMFLRQFDQICQKQISKHKKRFLHDLATVKTASLKHAVDELKLLKSANKRKHMLLKTYTNKLIKEAGATIVSAEALQVHRARKNVKMLLYLSAIFKRQKNQFALNRMKKTADLLGQWHDWLVLAEHLYGLEETVETRKLIEKSTENAHELLAEARDEWRLCISP